MMNDQLQKVLADVAGKYNDRRLHVCDVRADVDEEGGVKIAGRVLEAAYLDAIRASLPAGAKVDASGVHVLRRPSTTRMATVATNLTDLHVEPSFLSELLTQVMYGVTLEVLEEKDKWAFVRQADGYLGWAYRPYLTGDVPPEPTHLITPTSARVWGDPEFSEPAVTMLHGGTALRVDGARVEFAGGMLRGGYVLSETSNLRPLASLPLPAAQAREQMIVDARRYTGANYLWGGCSAGGIDCSGFAQLVHRLSGYTIPRDADMQFAAGSPVEKDFQPGDLLFFTGDHNKRKISHVGISTGGWNMIHSSRFHNGVYEDDVQQRPHLRDTFAGARTFVPPQ